MSRPAASRPWEIRRVDPARAEELARALGLPPLVARILVARGLGEPAAARRFLSRDLSALHAPDGLPDLAAAVERLSAALDRDERITLYGDYDVDGTTATAILVHFLRSLGGRVDWYLPDRVREGYGLSRAGIEAVAARGTRLVVTVDCGTNSLDEIARARELGMDVIVIDHHQTPLVSSPAVALLNPHRRDSAFPDRGLCSAGLAFYLCAALRRSLRERGRFARSAEPNLKAYLDLVALGTIADVAPLVGLNRLLVHHGLAALGEGRRPGLAALKSAAGLGPGPVSTGTVGFRLAPRLNAAGRLGDASRAVELMLCDDPRRAQGLAEELDRENARRQEVERAVVDEAVALVLAGRGHAEAPAIVVAGEGWHPGVIGIVAARLVERFGRPAVVIALDGGSGKGSARTAGSVNLYESLSACAPHLLGFGGHAAAAGLTIAASEVEAFRVRFQEVVGRLPEPARTPHRLVDAEVPPEAVDLDLAEALEVLRPFGEGNPEPVFVARGVEVEQARVVGGDHLRLRLRGARAHAIGFGMSEHLPEPGSRVDLCYSVRLSEWQGERRAEIHLREAPRPAGTAP